MQLLFANFQKGNGDIAENSEKLVDSRMQVRFMVWGYPPPFYYLQEGCG